MNDNFVILNTNFSKEHQAVITRLIYGLADLYLKDKTRFFPYPETMIDESQTSPAPDILLYDHANEKTVVIIWINRWLLGHSFRSCSATHFGDMVPVR